MDEIEKKKQKKKEYNERYLCKLRNSEQEKEQVKEHAKETPNEKTTDDIKKLIHDEMNFFFQNQKAKPVVATPAAPPPPIIIQAPPSNLKNKMLETLMITGLGLIPLIFKAVYQAKFSSGSTDTLPKQSNVQLPHATDTQLLFS
jgi:hypothetical protein